jgi:hypothetical protein
MDPQAFVQGLVNRGWSVPEASAAAGNAHVESGFRPGIVAPNGDTGLLQWNGPRLAGMQRYAAATGRDWRDPEAQLDWIAMERSGDSRRFGVDERGGYRKAFAGGGAPGDMAAGFGQYVERPADLSASVAQRSAMATAYGGGAPAQGFAVMPAAAPAVASPVMFARTFAPSEVAPGGAIAFPSPAPTAEGGGGVPPTGPDIIPPGPAQPPPQPVPPVAPAPSGAPPPPVEPKTKGTAGMPLGRVETRGADGTVYSYDYGSPSDFMRQMKEAHITSLETASDDQLQALKQIQQRDEERRLTTEADLNRYLRPQTAEEKQVNSLLAGQRKAIDKLYEDFPDPADRDVYIGWYNMPYREVLQRIHENPDFGRFVQDLEPFNKFAEVQRSLPFDLQVNVGSYIPTGNESYPRDFEQHLFEYKNAVREQLDLATAANRMPVGQVTPAWWNAQRERMRSERVATPDEMVAMGMKPPAPRGGEQPPTVQLAPRAQSTGPIVSYGHSMYAP